MSKKLKKFFSSSKPKTPAKVAKSGIESKPTSATKTAVQNQLQTAAPASSPTVTDKTWNGVTVPDKNGNDVKSDIKMQPSVAVTATALESETATEAQQIAEKTLSNATGEDAQNTLPPASEAVDKSTPSAAGNEFSEPDTETQNKGIEGEPEPVANEAEKTHNTQENEPQDSVPYDTEDYASASVIEDRQSQPEQPESASPGGPNESNVSLAQPNENMHDELCEDKTTTPNSKPDMWQSFLDVVFPLATCGLVKPQHQVSV